jgi:RNA recognition motif. (a.k.a. RRM, RBD, or RNP domain)
MMPAALKSYFSKFGDIAEVQIMQDHMSGRSRGFGFVTFEEDSSADRVFEEGTMHEIGGKKVEVKAATPKGSGSVAARQQQQDQHQHQASLQLPQQHSPLHPMRGRSSAEYDPAMMRAFASGMPGPAGYPAYPVMYGYGGRPTMMPPPGSHVGSYNTSAAASLTQYPTMQHGHYMMMPPPSAMGPTYTPAGYTYQQQSYTTPPGGGGAGGGHGGGNITMQPGGGGMPYTPPSPQGMLQQLPFNSPGIYPSSSSPSTSPPYQRSSQTVMSQRGGEVPPPRSKSSASRTKVDSASSLDAHAQVERQMKRMGLDR